jgi:topoisomerase-4 subunit A
VSEKAFLGKDILYVNVFRRDDTRTVYNILFRDGRNGVILMKRFNVTGLMRDKEYDITKGTPGSQILYFGAHPNGEADILKVIFRPRPRMKKIIEELDFSTQAVRSRTANGNIFSKFSIHKIVLKEKSESTLGGKKIWLDNETNKLNDDGKGLFLGEFTSDDKILVLTKQAYYYTTSYELVNRYEDDILLIKKFESGEIFSFVYFDATLNQYCVKRIVFDKSLDKERFIDEDPDSRLVAFSTDRYPQLKVTFKGRYAGATERIDVDEFVAVKSVRGKGRKLTTREVSSVKFIEPLNK